MCLGGVETHFNKGERNIVGQNENLTHDNFSIFSQDVKPQGAQVGYDLMEAEFKNVRWYVLNNCLEIDQYLK